MSCCSLASAGGPCSPRIPMTCEPSTPHSPFNPSETARRVPGRAGKKTRGGAMSFGRRSRYNPRAPHRLYTHRGADEPRQEHSMAMRHTLVLAAAALAGAACSPQRFFLKTAWVDGVNYVASPDVTGHDFTQVGDGVYAFHSGFYSNIVIKTGEGLVVTDPMGVENAKLLRSELDRAFPGWPVHTMIYSHYHLDHVTGGAALGAKNILAHPSCAKRWQDIGAKDIAMPT